VFFYSRKPQLMLFFCWCIALAGMFVYVTDSEPLFFAQQAGPIEQARALIGKLPFLREAPPSPPAPPADPPAPPPVVLPPVSADPPAPPPADPPAPAPALPAALPADPTLNRATDLRIFPGTDADKNVLAVELDYVAAQRNGFTPDKAHSYYTADTPTVVVVLDRPWEIDAGRKAYALDMEQATRVGLWMTNARQLRLITRTRTVAQAAGARVRIHETSTGIRVEIHFSR
jgi:hypothetical protein